MRVRQLAIGAIAVGLCLTACGSGSSGGSSGGSSSAGGGGSVQGINGKVITIGSSAIESGPYSAYSQIAIGLNAYIKYINGAGGAGGYTFKVIQQDNAYQAAQSVAVARNLVFSDKTFLLTLAGTTPTQAVLPLATQLKVPVVFVANADLVKKTIPNVFGEEPSFTRLALADAKYIMTTLGQKKIAYAYENDDIGQPPLQALPGYVQSQGGSVVTKLGFPATATDYSSYASRLKASGAGAVLVFAGPGSIAGLQKAAAAIGYKPKWFGLFASVTPAYVQLAGALANGTYFDNFFETTTSNTASVKLFRQQVGAKNVGLLSELGWTDGALIAEGIKRAAASGGVTDSSFEAALNTLNHSAVGVWPDATFTSASHSGATSADVLQVKGGKFVPVTKFVTLPQIP
jgi:branched-chain amino acid transport system substrate-binding protein